MRNAAGWSAGSNFHRMDRRRRRGTMGRSLAGRVYLSAPTASPATAKTGAQNDAVRSPFPGSAAPRSPGQFQTL